MPFKDLEYLTRCNAVRSNGSATATEASNANKFVITGCPRCGCLRLITIIRELLSYIDNLVDQRLAEPKSDIISKLVVEQV